MRIATSGGRGWGGEETADCIWNNGFPSPNSSGEEEYEQEPDDWIEKQQHDKTPDAREKYDGDLEVMNDRISLKGRTLQVIVKLANIVLTPEKPHYPGGTWHVEGLYQRSSDVPGHCQLNFSTSKVCKMRRLFPALYT